MHYCLLPTTSNAFRNFLPHFWAVCVSAYRVRDRDSDLSSKSHFCQQHSTRSQSATDNHDLPRLLPGAKAAAHGKPGPGPTAPLAQARTARREPHRLSWPVSIVKGRSACRGPSAPRRFWRRQLEVLRFLFFFFGITIDQDSLVVFKLGRPASLSGYFAA